MKKVFLECGQVVNTHGVRGEIKMQHWCDTPEFLYAFDTLYFEEKSYKVTGMRAHKDCLLVKLDGVDTIEDALAFKGRVVCIRRGDMQLEDGAVFVQDIIGFDVFDRRTRRVIGKLKDVWQRPANDVYVVGNGEKEYLIPAVPQFINAVDENNHTIDITTIEGMLDED